MKACVVFLLAAGVSMFTLAESLQCYSCPAGSAETCESKAMCSSPDDSCLKLTSQNPAMTYRKCIPYSECTAEKLAMLYPAVSKFKSSCCQTNLCNSAHSLAAKPLIGLLLGLAALCWGMH